MDLPCCLTFADALLPGLHAKQSDAKMAFCMSALSTAMPTVGVRVAAPQRAARAAAPVSLAGSMSNAVSLRTEGACWDSTWAPRNPNQPRNATPTGDGVTSGFESRRGADAVGPL